MKKETPQDGYCEQRGEFDDVDYIDRLIYTCGETSDARSQQVNVT